MIDFMYTYWDSALCVVAFSLLCIVLIKKGYRTNVEEMLFHLVCKAEELYGSGTGELKYASVVLWVHEKLPTLIQIVFSEKELDEMIEGAVERMKDYLNNNYKALCRITEGK